MFCRKCGGENVDGDKFCKHCGYPIGENAENQTTQNTATEKNDILKSINVNQLMDKIKVVPKKIIAGVLAGLAGATFYAGYTNHIKVGVLPTQGYDGIAVALLGLNTPIGVFLSAALFGFMKVGGAFMQAMANIPNELVDIIISTIIYFSAIALLFQSFFKKVARKKKDGGVK